MTDETLGQIETLRAAIAAAEGRVQSDALDDAKAVLERATMRLHHSSEHTVVALGGATGSGKSSLFNALSGIDLAGVGVRRPTTSWTLACTWGRGDSDELLEWIGIPPQHRLSRSGPLDDDAGADDELDGLILLDMPDHDSIFDAHHHEVDRVVGFADLFVWVLDPQKYADAALHDNYLSPLGRNRETTMVVLNQVDRLDMAAREAILADLGSLLEREGLTAVPLIPVSARTGEGLDRLRAEVAARVRARHASRQRVDADVAAAITRLEMLVAGTQKVEGITPERWNTLCAEVEQICDIDRIASEVRDDAETLGKAATRWLPFGTRGKPHGTVPLEELTSPGNAAKLSTAVRSFAVASGVGLPSSWRMQLRKRVDAIDSLPQHLSTEIAGVELPLGARDGWWIFYRVVQTALQLLVLALVLLGVLLRANVFAVPAAFAIGGKDWLAALAVAGVLAVLSVLWFVWARRRAARVAQLRHDDIRAALSDRVVTVLRDDVERAVVQELRSHSEFAELVSLRAAPAPATEDDSTDVAQVADAE